MLSLSILLALSQLTLCLARPVYHERPHQIPKASGKDKLDMPKDWLSLRIGAPTHVDAATVASTSTPQHQQPMLEFQSARPFPFSLESSISTQNIESNQAHAAREDSHRKRIEAWRVESANKRRARAYGIQKQSEREIWESKHPNQTPPLRLMTNLEMIEIGLVPYTNRYKLSQELEDGVRGRIEIDGQKEDKGRGTSTSRRYIPLRKKIDKDKPLLIRKQKELNDLLNRGGFLTMTSTRRRPLKLGSRSSRKGDNVDTISISSNSN